MEKAEAVEWITEYLRDQYPRARSMDRHTEKLMLAFPHGLVDPKMDSEGELIGFVAVVPEDYDPTELLREAQGSKQHYDAALVLASYMLSTTGHVSHAGLRAFLTTHLQNPDKRPSGRRGRPSQEAHSARYGVLRLAIAMLEKEGFGATRGKESLNRNSACDIVAEAMGKLSRCEEWRAEDVPSSYDRIVDILKSGDRTGI